MQEIIAMSSRELQRTQVLEQVIRGTVLLKEAAAIMKLCYRQARRLLARYRKEGPKGLIHHGRGRPASNAWKPEIRNRVLRLHREIYANFNDTHFVEMLQEREGLRLGRETVRRWLRGAGLAPKRRRRPPKHRSRRVRKPQIGLLMQWDGSPHRWFGPLRLPVCLLHAADDATGTALGALFRPQEDSLGYLRLMDMVLRRHGIPAAVYQDRHSALFRNDSHWSHEEELAGVRYPTQVGRVLAELGSQTIPAFSAQAKGRIERLGGTFQDRLVAEMAREGITDIDLANEWLDKVFLDRFNRRFAKSPEQSGSAFRKISDALRYQLVSFTYQATVANDNSVRLGGLIIDIPPGPRGLSFAHRRVLVRQHLDGAWTVWSENRRIGSHPPTPLREPFKSRRPHQPGEMRNSHHILQVYLETTPAPVPEDIFARQLGGHIDLA